MNEENKNIENNEINSNNEIISGNAVNGVPGELGDSAEIDKIFDELKDIIDETAGGNKSDGAIDDLLADTSAEDMEIARALDELADSIVSDIPASNENLLDEGDGLILGIDEDYDIEPNNDTADEEHSEVLDYLIDSAKAMELERAYDESDEFTADEEPAPSTDGWDYDPMAAVDDENAEPSFLDRVNAAVYPVTSKLPSPLQKAFLPFLVAVLLILLTLGVYAVAHTVAKNLDVPDSLVSDTIAKTDGTTEVISTADAAIADETDDATAEDTTEEETTEEPTTEGIPVSFYNYLTGVDCTEEESRKRPIAVMINNVREAMPNVGIGSAEIVYECVVEGGATRLLMLLKDYESVPVFGSVRSCREYYIDFAQIHDAIYVHAGGSDQGYAELYSRSIDRLDGVNMNFPNTFFRDTERRRTMALEHTLMATGEGIKIGIETAGYRQVLRENYNGTFNFADEPFVPFGWTANLVRLSYSASMRPEFSYNETDKKYYRSQFGNPHIDGATGEQISFENILVLFVPQDFTNDSKGHMAVNFTGDGTGYYISNGKYMQLRWHRDTKDSELVLTEFKEDKPLVINKGRTFISIFAAENSQYVAIG